METRYKIKREDVSEKVLAIPGFADRFEKSCLSQLHDNAYHVSVRYPVVDISDSIRCWVNARIDKSIIYDSREYSSMGWNVFPTVLPPVDTLMQVELLKNGTRVFSGAGYFCKDGRWSIYGYGVNFFKGFVIKYKEWG